MKISSIKKDIDKVFDKKEVVLHSDITGKDYKVVIDKKFKKSKITALFTAMMERADACRKNDIIFDFALCQWCMIIAHFTDLQFDKGNDIISTYLKEIKGMETLIDIEVLDSLISEFDENEMLKLQEVGKALGKFTKKMHDIEVDQLVDDIVGDEVGTV